MKTKHNGNFGRDKHRSIHHIVPTSRGGPNGNGEKIFWNKFPWRVNMHVAWHALFHNYLPSEAIFLIKRCWMKSDGTLDEVILGDALHEAWLEIFGGLSPRKAISFIEENFLSAETRFRGEMKVARLGNQKLA